MTEPRRGRGRPRASDTEDRRAAILAVARAQFATRGFAGTSLRGIAREVGCDVSLISHYFGDKSALLVATMQIPVDPTAKIAEVVAGGADGLGERLVRTFLGAWDPHHEVFSTLIRTILGSADAEAAPAAQVAREVLLTSLRGVIEGDDRDLRAAGVASQVLGLAIARYVVRLDPVATASIDDVVRVHAPGIQALVDGTA